jgi:hypothetical protein
MRSPQAEESQGRRRTVRVLYVAGLGRSGSTILDRMLGQQPGFASFGELSKFWSHVVVAPQRCGCGSPFPECPWWMGMADKHGELFDADLATRVYHLHERFLRTTDMPRLWQESLRRNILTRFPAWYSKALADLYEALDDATGGAVIVDSSKNPLYGYLLACVPGLEVRFVHLVRDPRAVVFSWTRHQRDGGSIEGRFMHRYPAHKSAMFWMVWNETMERLNPHLGQPALRLRYEDLVADPTAVMDRIFASLERVPEPLASGRSLRLGVDHTVSGNPSRFRVGEVPVVADLEWQQGQRRADRVVTTALCSPRLHRYGYPVRVR